MTVVRTDFEGEPNIGAFCIATDSFVLVSSNVSDKSLALLEQVFGLPIVQSTVATLDAVGIMCAANSHGIVVPYTTTDEELSGLRRSVDVTVEWIDSKMTAMGNIIMVNDKGALCHPEFDERAIRVIADTLDVEVVRGTVAKLPLVGSGSVATNRGVVTHPLATDDEMTRISEVLGVNVEVGTVNRGSPYPRLGVIANSVGMIAGSETTGVELAHISQVLGLT
ncbi:MAG: translation initiation factor IF-6 [Candidatus Thorarchaeota archaeon]